MLRFGCIDINSSSVKDISQYNAFRAISCFSFIGRGRERRTKKRGKKSWDFPFTFPSADREKHARNRIKLTFVLSARLKAIRRYRMAVLVVRSKFNPARKSRILISGYNFAADRPCFSHPSSSVSPFEN